MPRHPKGLPRVVTLCQFFLTAPLFPDDANKLTVMNSPSAACILPPHSRRPSERDTTRHRFPRSSGPCIAYSEPFCTVHVKTIMMVYAATVWLLIVLYPRFGSVRIRTAALFLFLRLSRIVSSPSALPFSMDLMDRLTNKVAATLKSYESYYGLRPHHDPCRLLRDM